ncbi:hypothetical protein [Achromobacter sp.]|uniref:hypothetical protein n=1 Tax=Achromobacter sp. TaxID=134375 RepID=UPI0028A9D034|nr:hypothetical protein [Achromobacter sp.]
MSRNADLFLTALAPAIWGSTYVSRRRWPAWPAWRFWLTPKAALDPVGIATCLGSALSMALGTVLSRPLLPDPAR